MSERAPSAPETHRPAHTPEKHRKQPESSSESLKDTERSAEDLRAMSDSALEKAKQSDELLQSIHSETATKKEAHTPTWTNPALRNQSFSNVMRSTRRKLGPVDRSFSKIIHNPTIERVSETSSKTIARPTPIVAGALLSLVGSILVLYYAKRNGFEVQPMLFVVLFGIGYLAGFAIDIVLSGLKKITSK